MTGRSSLDYSRKRPPPLETALSDASAPDQNGTPISPKLHTPNVERYPMAEEVDVPVQHGYQRFVLADPVAFRYLAEDSSCTVLDSRRELRGYECFVVEQWTTSRAHPTFMITTYTGDPAHVIVVSIMSVPIDENTWSPRLRVYFKALNQFHARRRDTPLGILMVTNLSGFPSSLTVISVPDGDVRKHRFDFFVNEDLKRLGCSGRTGLSLSQPAATTVVKFHQLFRTSDKNDIYRAVLELVKLCQSALTLFDKLETDYADGLLCDVTERAINDWWVDIGSEYYNMEPHDGILGPTTVAGLLGLLMGARNRLHAVNAPVSKDAFDVEAMKRAIGHFQRQQRVTRTRRLDRRTLDRLHKVTQKAAEKERWAVPKAVKSTVAELSGKGGEMVMEAVGRRDRAGIAEIETVDMERFVQLVYGDRAKWLWFGKPMKKAKGHDSQLPQEVQGEPGFSKALTFKPDDHGGFTWIARAGSHDKPAPIQRHSYHHAGDDYNRPASVEGGDDSDDANHSFFKRATTFKDDAKTGLGKVRGAVGLRGHKHKHSTGEPAPTSPTERDNKDKRPLLKRALSSPISSPSSAKGPEKDIPPMPAVAEQSDRLNVALGRERADTVESRSTRDASPSKVRSNESLTPFPSYNPDQSTDEQDDRNDTDPSRTATASASIAGSVYNGIDLNDVLPTGPETEADTSHLLRRTISDSQFIDIKLQSHDPAAYPRHLSFSLAEDSILHWDSFLSSSSSSAETNPSHDPSSTLYAQVKSENLLANKQKSLHHLITHLQTYTASWTATQISLLRQTLLQKQERDLSLLTETIHDPHLQNVREIQTHSEGLLRENRETFEEDVKEIETMAAKLEYEISALRSKVEDVEAGVGDFEKGVARVEERVGELEREGNRSGWACTVQ
ncbi:Hypothetical predicted protein [Lecanosticta acicola]|uniref:STB6-like N-terminal domain-containing protein n=1 Tax=Lecanosticta acicola TaxID=111012 RepID=A0AAI9EDN8_9PEZI|nr:Hypothetical predicted protein [Lecanosticta acicola]